MEPTAVTALGRALAQAAGTAKRKPFMSISSPDTSPAGVVAAEAVLQNPATLRDLLAAQSYVWFWIGAVCNRLAVQIQAIALAWQVYAVARHSASVNQAALAVGMLGLAQFLPMFALTLFAGHAADIYDRRKIMMAGLGVQLCTSALFGAMAYGGLNRPLADLRDRGFVRLRPGLLYAVERGARADPGRAAADPARDRRQFGGQSDGDHRRPRHRRAPGGVFARCGFRRVGRALPRLARFAFARGVAAAPASSDRLALGADRRRASTMCGRPRSSSARSALTCSRFSWAASRRSCRSMRATSCMSGRKASESCAPRPSAGAIVTGFVLAARPLKSRVGLKMFAAVGIYGLSTLVFALSRSMVLSVLALAVLGAADMVSVFVRQSLVQIVTPDAMRGRVSAVSSLFIGASNELGEFESGGMARLLGPVGSAIFGGCGAIVVTLLWAGIFPALRKADRLE